MSAPLISLGEICEVLDRLRRPVTKRDRVAGVYPYYGATGIVDYVCGYIFNEKLVLIGEDGAKWGAGENTAFPAEGKYWVNNHAHIIRPDRSRVLDEWIIYYLNFIDLSKFTTGLTVPKLNQEKLCQIPVALPPLSEQQRIVAILDEAFAGLATATANVEKNLKNASELFDSYLTATLSSGSVGWAERSLGDPSLLAIVDGDRGTSYPKKTDFASSGHCLFLNTKNVRPDGFNFDETMFISQRKDEQLRKGKLERGDVVLTTRGTIGNVAVYDQSVPFDHVRINSGMLIFRPNTKRLLPRYLFELFRTGAVKAQIVQHVSGAAQPQLPIKTLVKFTIPVPDDVRDQQRLADMLLDMSTETSRLASNYELKISSCEELKQALLQKAFSGDLTAPPLSAIKEAAE